MGKLSFMFRTVLRFFAVFVFLASALLVCRAEAMVVIDAGHGGFEQGIAYREKKAIMEKDITLLVGKSLAAALQENGVRVFVIRDVDRNLTLTQREAMANEKKPALFLSFHLAAADVFNIYVTWLEPAESDPKRLYLQSGKQRLYIEDSRQFASMLRQSIKEAFPGKGVNSMEMPLPLLTAIGAPAVLVEAPHPRHLDYSSPQIMGQVTAAIANAVSAFGAR